MRCPSCDAANPDGAAFCGQCYDRFDDHPAGTTTRDAAADPAWDAGDAEMSGAEARDGAEDQPPGAAREPSVATDPPPRAQVGRFTADGDVLTWTCAVCAASHPFGEFTCAVCGARMDAEAPDPDAVPIDWERARRAEALVPGLGHLRAGHVGMGIARGGIVAVWLVGSLLLAGGGISGLLTALPLIAGMAVIWSTGPADLQATSLGRSPRLDGRRFMYLVVGATTGVIVAGGLALLL